jgi:hypothetical protein
MIDPRDLGWMAGVIDLKGRLLHKKNQTRRTRQIVLAVETQQMEIINGLSQLTGTEPEIMAAKPLSEFLRRACAEHCVEAHVHVEKYGMYMPATGRWTITGGGMVVVLDTLMPYLRVDRGYREATQEATEFLTLNGRGSGAVIRSLLRLRGLGWKLRPEFEKAAVRPVFDEEESLFVPSQRTPS